MSPLTVELEPVRKIWVDRDFQLFQRSASEFKVSFIGHRFAEFFNGMFSKCEFNTILEAVDVPRGGFDERHFIEANGGELRSAVQLAQIWALLSEQDLGEPGILRVDGELNVFFVHDKKQFLCMVYISWEFASGWRIDAGYCPAGHIDRPLRVFKPKYR